MDVGLLLLRLLLAALLIAHGTQKAFGWFDGPGIASATALFEKLGQYPAGLKVRVAIVCELGSAALLMLGLGTALGAAVAAGTMLVAGGAMQALSGKFWNSAGGGEYPFALAGLAVAVGFTGAGTISADHLILKSLSITISPTATALVGTAAAVVALAAATPQIITTRRAIQAAQP